MSDHRILATNEQEHDAIAERNTKSISISKRTYKRLLNAGKFSDRTFDGIISRILDEYTGKETNLEERSF